MSFHDEIETQRVLRSWQGTSGAPALPRLVLAAVLTLMLAMAAGGGLAQGTPGAAPESGVAAALGHRTPSLRPATSAGGTAAPGLGIIPLYFEAEGPAGGSSEFLARSRDGQMLISATGAGITLRDRTQVQMRFPGSNAGAGVSGRAEQAGKINYFTGSDPARWRTGIPTFAKVQIENLYPGIDAVYYGDEQQLEYDFNVAPGASPEAIRIRYEGAERISIDAAGQLTLWIGRDKICQGRPAIYQFRSGRREEVAGGFKMLDAQTVAFTVAAYDRQQPLVIDPVLNYSSYLGGSAGDAAYALALHTNDGSIFVTGQTLSANWGANGYQKTFQGGPNYGDAFVAKFAPATNPPAMQLVYLTYLGGGNDDLGSGIAVDARGRAFVAGYTDSPNFPVTTAAHPIPGVSSSIGGSLTYGYYPFDAFVTELETNGAALIYSTFLGGNLEDGAYDIAVDSQDNAYVVGFTSSVNFPVRNAIPFTLAGSANHTLSTLACPNTYYNCNGFITEIAAGGSNLVCSSYFGGNNYDVATGVAVDHSNNVYVTGYTASGNFPNTNAVQIQTGLDGSFDAFVAKLAPGNSTLNLLYSTFLGGVNDDVADHIAADGQGAAYVTGWTASPNFYNSRPNTIANALANDDGGVYTTNVFLAKITNNVNGAALTNLAGIAYSVAFGGLDIDVGNGVAVDAAGNAFVTGMTTSGGFSTVNTQGLLNSYNSGGYDAFVTAFNADCSQVIYSALLGGSGDDAGYSIALDANDTAYIAGLTYSGNFPVTASSTNVFGNAVNDRIYGAQSASLGGGNDGFVAEILAGEFTPPLALATAKTNKVTLSWRNYTEPAAGTFALETTPALLVTNLVAGVKIAGGVTNHVTVTNWIPTTSWVPVTNVPAVSNGFNFLTLTATNKSQFFRLVP